MKHRWRIAALLAAFVAVFALWWRLAMPNPAVVFGGVFWIPVSADDWWVPRPVRLAMQDPPPAATPGPLSWKTLAPGFEAAELPVRAANEEVDRILLARIDPRRFRFVVRNQPKGDRARDDWMDALCPALLVNGSYFERDGTPSTPVISDGRPLGPRQYVARQGAFVASDGAAHIVDLAQRDWRDALRGADAAMVSYPLLLAADGGNRAPKSTGWLANRSFVGEDAQGRIVIGTTKGAFFSLDRLALFIKQAPLGLKRALNLDGGPVACQAIHLNGFDRRACGSWEMQVENGRAKVLPPLRLADPPMPMVLAVFPRGGKPCGP